MRDEVVHEDPLLRAVADLRAEVDRVIDAEIARLGQAAPRPEPVNGRHAPAAVRPPIAAPEPASGEVPLPAPEAEDGDPGKRLDALAQRLEGRLRRSREKTNGRPGPDAA